MIFDIRKLLNIFTEKNSRLLFFFNVYSVFIMISNVYVTLYNVLKGTDNSVDSTCTFYSLLIYSFT